MAELVGSFSPLEPGEVRDFMVIANLVCKLQIWCFVQPPTPPIFMECPDYSNKRELRSGEKLSISVPKRVYGLPTGIELRLIEDGREDSIYQLLILFKREGGTMAQVMRG